MLKLIKRLLFGRELADVLAETRIVKVHGIRFTIKKLDPTSFLDGSTSMLQVFDTYKLKKETQATEVTKQLLEKLQKHYRDVFCNSVVYPVLCRKKEEAKEGEIFVDHLFTEWELANELYARIAEFTYGKKKFKQNIYRAKSS